MPTTPTSARHRLPGLKIQQGAPVAQAGDALRALSAAITPTSDKRVSPTTTSPQSQGQPRSPRGRRHPSELMAAAVLAGLSRTNTLNETVDAQEEAAQLSHSPNSPTATFAATALMRVATMTSQTSSSSEDERHDGGKRAKGKAAMRDGKLPIDAPKFTGTRTSSLRDGSAPAVGEAGWSKKNPNRVRGGKTGFPRSRTGVRSNAFKLYRLELERKQRKNRPVNSGDGDLIGFPPLLRVADIKRMWEKETKERQEEFLYRSHGMLQSDIDEALREFKDLRRKSSVGGDGDRDGDVEGESGSVGGKPDE